jgi:hypothetical protein
LKRKKRKKESRYKSRNDEREWRETPRTILIKTLKQVQGGPTGSEEWMLCLLDFFLFLFKKLHYRLVEVLLGTLLWKRQSNTPKHRSPDFFRDEERSGGVAAIEQPPEAENCSWRGTRRKMKE